MILLERALFSFGARTILGDVDLMVPDGARVGLVGRNGVGKTTFFRILLGELRLDAGTMQIPSGQRVVYLSQHPHLPEDASILQHVLESHPTLRDLEEQVLGIERRMAEEPDPVRLDRLVERHRALRREFEAQGGYEVEARVEGILHGLGFTREDLPKTLGHLSPGEKNRVALAKVLLSEADILLLDEPTNHLDFQMLEWLEAFLQAPPWGDARRPVTAVVASHDRYFLNRFADRIVELRDGTLAAYRGNYDDFAVQRSEELERQAKEYRLRQVVIQKELEFIRRNFAAQKARQAKSREKKVARLEKEAVEQPRSQEDGPRIRFDAVSRSGDDVLRIRDLECGFGVPLVSGANLEFRRGDRIAIVGPNGCGKTTLLRCIVGHLRPTSGEVRPGLRTVVGYYEQDLSRQGGDRTIHEEVHDIVPRWTDQEVRDLLAAFLFRGDEIELRTATLSGGEKARLALIRLILSGANLLVLDEPTNHLDVFARAALEESLLEFPGTILFVSHDRYFLERLATRTFAIRGGFLEEFIGGYEEYRETIRADIAEAEAARVGRSRAEKASAAPAPARLAGGQEEERILRAISKLEDELREKHAEAAREESYRNPDAMRKLKRETKELEERIEDLYRKWEGLAS